MTMHGLTEMDKLPTSILEVENFWQKTCYNVGGFIFSLDDIEHGVLRGEITHAEFFWSQQDKEASVLCSELSVDRSVVVQ